MHRAIWATLILAAAVIVSIAKPQELQPTAYYLVLSIIVVVRRGGHHKHHHRRNITACRSEPNYGI